MDESIKEAYKLWIQEKLLLTTDSNLFFNGLLSEAMMYIFRLKTSKDELHTIVANFKEYFIPFFEMAKDDIDGFVDQIAKSISVEAKNPIINLLYRKLSVIVGVVVDTESVGIPEKEQNEIKIGLKFNLERVCEVLDVFIDVWSPEMNIVQTQEVVNKLADQLNRKYNKESYDMFS